MSGEGSNRTSLGFGSSMGGMAQRLEEAKKLASSKAKEMADAVSLEAAAKQAKQATAAMAATKNSIREAVDGSQQVDSMLREKNRRILQLEDDVAMLQNKLKQAHSDVPNVTLGIR